MARVLEDAKVERLPMRLNAPGDSMTRFNINPTNKVGLEKRKNKDGRNHWLVEGSVSASFRHIPLTLLWISNSSMAAMAAQSRQRGQVGNHFVSEIERGR